MQSRTGLMKSGNVARLAITAMLLACGNDSPSDPIDKQPPPPPPPPGNVTVSVNTTVTHQTMTGWQANAQAGQWEASYAQWRDAVRDRAVEDGINRLRVDVRSGVENPTDSFNQWISGQVTEAEWRCARYETVNDNANPAVLDMTRFNFGEIDTTMVRVVLPMREKLQQRGEVLGLTATYVRFGCMGGQYVHSNAAEYGEFAVAVMNHLRDRFGFVPDTWEIINEPDNTGGVWSPTLIREAVLEIDQRLRQAGYTSIQIIAPSHANATSALNAATTLMSSAAGSLVDQIGYHRYGGATQSTVQSLGTLAGSRGLSTAMTEHIGSGYDDLLMDITLGRASTWEQYVLAFPTSDNGAQYYTIQGTTVNTGSRTKWLRHYFRHVRRGAVRVEATTATGGIVPVAFRNPNGRVAVIVKYDSPGTISIGGLPAGTYGVGFESQATSDGTMPDVTVGSDGVATLQVQSQGVVALFGRS